MKTTKFHISSVKGGVSNHLLVSVLAPLMGLMCLTCAGHAGGRVIGWGTGDPITKMPADLTNIIAVAAGSRHAVALRADRTVAAWGYGSGTNVPSGLTHVTAVAAGSYYSLALTGNGTVVAWGSGPAVSELPAGLQDVAAISAGYDHCLALKNDGSVVAWGAQNFGCLNVPGDLTNAIAVAAGHSQNLALRADGTVVFWGYATNTLSPPTGLGNVQGIAIGCVTGGSVDTTHCLALRNDGTVVAWGRNNWHQADVPADLPKAMAVAAGLYHSLALTEDYRVMSWGADDAGQCTPPPELTAASAIAAAGRYSLAILRELPPVISGQPQSRLVNTGETVTLAAAGNGTPPLSWQWYFNGQPVPWGTGSSLTITNVQLSDCGCYQAVLSNPYGNATSAVATVAIRVLNLQKVAGLTIENPPGTPIRVEWSEDLQTWFPLTNFVLPTSPYRFVDWESAGRPQRYYRLLP